MNAKRHWEQLYSTFASPDVSWYQRSPTRSLELISRARVSLSDPIIDVGGGDSTLVDHLLARGHTQISVLDIAGVSLERAQARLGARAAGVRWIEADIIAAKLAPASIGVWHDRATFHFLTSPSDRAAYIALVRRTVRPGGHVIIATFAEDGPTHCSGLPVHRYSAESMHGAFGADFLPLGHAVETHVTPTGATQRFLYCWCAYRPLSAAHTSTRFAQFTVPSHLRLPTSHAPLQFARFPGLPTTHPDLSSFASG